MNRIRKKAIFELEQMDPELLGQDLTQMLGILKGETHHFFQKFLLLQLVLDSGSLNEEEKGYIYYTFLDANFTVLNHPAYRYNNNFYYQLVKEYALSNAMNKDVYYLLEKTNAQKLQLMKEMLVDQREKEYMDYIRVELAIYSKFFQAFSKIDAILEVKEAMMVLDLPIDVQESLLCYYDLLCKERTAVQPLPVFSQPKVNISTEEEPRLSKKELKSQLKEYFDEDDEMKPFDFIHYEDVIVILKQLNYSEKHIIDIISVLLRNHMENYFYYFYICQKYMSQFPNGSLLQEVQDAWQSMIIPEKEEDYDFYKEYILANISSMEQDLVGNYDYDLKRVYSKK